MYSPAAVNRDGLAGDGLAGAGLAGAGLAGAGVVGAGAVGADGAQAASTIDANRTKIMPIPIKANFLFFNLDLQNILYLCFVLLGCFISINYHLLFDDLE